MGMHTYDAEVEDLADQVLAYVRWRLSVPEIQLDHSATIEELEEVAPSLISEQGNPASVVMAQFTDVIAPRVISVDSPRFLSFIPAAPTKASMLFDAIVSASSLNGTSWLEAAGAVHAENQVLRFLADMAGLPASAGGCFVSGGSAANLSALVVARDVRRRRVGDGRRLRIVASEQAHSSVVNTTHIIDVDVFSVPTRNGHLHGDDVAAAIAADPDPDSIAAVVATAGTTNAGIIDDLAGVGAAARSIDAWFHVDGAYGGAGLLSPLVRDRYRGIELADSFMVDPHKWLFAPFDCAALLYRHPQLARSVHTQDASYLDSIHTKPDEWNPTDYAYHLTRRARGLATWFSLAVHGVAAYRSAIERALQLAQYAARRIEAAEHLTLVLPPELSIVMFERTGWEAVDYDRWAQRLLADQVALVLPSKWQGRPIARLALLHPETPESLIDEILASMR